MTLLTIVQGAQDLISGMTRCTSVVGNTDPTVRQLLALAHEAGETLVQDYPWSTLHTSRTRTMVAAETQPTFLPTNFSRFVDNTMWNITTSRPVVGPLTPAEYNAVKARNASMSDLSFRKRGTSILIWPVPTAGVQLRFEYIDSYFCGSTSAGPYNPTWQADTDVAVLPERLFKLWIVWQWLARKGLDFQTELQEYERAFSAATAADGGRRTLNAAAGPERSPVYPPGVPEGSWSL